MKNNHATPNKLIKKVSQLILLPTGMLINIVKVYCNLTIGNLSFSRWRPRWTPKTRNGYISGTTQHRKLILMSNPMFYVSVNPMESTEFLPAYYFSRWRPRWMPETKKGYISGTTQHRKLILVSIPMFNGSFNPLVST